MASAIVLLAKLKCFPGRSIPSRLHNAWKMYIQWCHKNGKNTNIEDFSLREFKMKSNLGIDRCFNKDSKIHDIENIICVLVGASVQGTMRFLQLMEAKVQTLPL